MPPDQDAARRRAACSSRLRRSCMGSRRQSIHTLESPKHSVKTGSGSSIIRLGASDTGSVSSADSLPHRIQISIAHTTSRYAVQMSYYRYAYTSKQRRQACRLQPDRPSGCGRIYGRKIEASGNQEYTRASTICTRGIERRQGARRESVSEKAKADRGQGCPRSMVRQRWVLTEDETKAKIPEIGIRRHTNMKEQ
jgi:hypothetical protein